MVYIVLEEIQSPKPFPQAKVQRKCIKQNLLFFFKKIFLVCISMWIYVEGQRTALGVVLQVDFEMGPLADLELAK